MGLEPQNVNKKQTLTSKYQQTLNGNWVTLITHSAFYADAERKEAQPEAVLLSSQHRHFHSLSTQQCYSIFATKFFSELGHLTLFTIFFAGDQGLNYNVK